MEKLPLAGLLKFENDFNFNIEALRIADTFMVSMVRGVCSRCASYMRIVEEHILDYSEISFRGFFAATIDDFCDIFLLESSVERANGDGRVDFWTLYRDYDIFLEHKHSFYSLPVINDINLQGLWAEVTNQLNFNAELVGTKENIKIALFTVALYINDEVNNHNVLDELEEFKNDHINILEPKPNWTALWVLAEDLLNNYTSKRKKFVGMYFIAYIQHKPKIK